MQVRILHTIQIHCKILQNTHFKFFRYSNRHEENLLFGRGLKAGIDIREQKKNSW